MGKSNNKKNQTKKIRIVNKLTFPNGVEIRSFGKGTLKGKNVQVTEQPICIVSKEAEETTYVTLGKKELKTKSSKNGGLEVI